MINQWSLESSDSWTFQTRHGASCPVGLGVSCSADRQLGILGFNGWRMLTLDAQIIGHPRTASRGSLPRSPRMAFLWKNWNIIQCLGGKVTPSSILCRFTSTKIGKSKAQYLPSGPVEGLSEEAWFWISLWMLPVEDMCIRVLSWHRSNSWMFTWKHQWHVNQDW